MISDKINQIDFDDLENSINEISEYIKYDDYDGAFEILSEVMEQTSDIYKEDSNERYFCFDSPIHYYIYDFKLEPKKLIKRSQIDYRTLHMCHAHILMADEKYKEAEDELRNALYWNPVDSKIFFELAKLYRITNEWSKFLIVIKAVRSYILDKKSLSKYYAYAGEYYLNKRDYRTAASLYYISESINPNNIAAEGINTILEETKRNTVPYQNEELASILKKDEIKFAPDGEIIDLIYDLSYEMQNKLNHKGAIHCLDVLYELTEDEKYLNEKNLISE